MKTPVVIFDVNYLCWRSHYTTGALTHDYISTGVLFGVFRDIRTAINTFDPSALVFCFDHGKSIRKQKYPFYKLKSVESTERATVEKQISLLKKETLRNLGFENIFYQSGFEGDDVIACLIKQNKTISKYGAVVVSGDKDLYQLLRYDNTYVFHPKKQIIVSKDDFFDKYGIPPEFWAKVKMLGGCKSDKVKPVVPGFGEITALAYIKNQLYGTPVDTRTKNKITKLESEEALRNMEVNSELVTIPHPDLTGGDYTINFGVDLDVDKWNREMYKYGMDTLVIKTKRTSLKRRKR